MTVPAWLQAIGKEWVPQRGQTRYYINGWNIGRKTSARVWIGAEDLEVHVDKCDDPVTRQDVLDCVNSLIESAKEEASEQVTVPTIDSPDVLHREVNKTFETICALYSATEPGTAKQALAIIVQAYEDAMPLLEEGME